MKGSKAKKRLARLHARIGNIRSDALHQLTTDLTRQFHTIGIEDLNVKGMMRNRYLSRFIADMVFLRRVFKTGLRQVDQALIQRGF